jgi:hypothetical protein
VLAAILLVPVGVEAGYERNNTELSARVGPFRIKIFPKKEKPKKPPKKPVYKEEEAEKEKKPLDLDKIVSLIKPGVRALKRIRRRLSVDFLALHYTAAASDPFDAALQYGKVSAAAGVLLPLLEEAVKIRERDFDINVSFETEKPELYMRVVASLQTWEILYIGFAFLAEHLKGKHKKRRENRAEERKSENGQASYQRLDGSYHV